MATPAIVRSAKSMRQYATGSVGHYRSLWANGLDVQRPACSPYGAEVRAAPDVSDRAHARRLMLRGCS